VNGNNNVTKILIAHLTEDRSAAENLMAQLLTYADERLECLLWEENRQNRLEELRQNIEDTDLLLLLVVRGSVDNGDWGWLQWATSISWSRRDGHFYRILLHNTSLTPPLCIQVAINRSFNSSAGAIQDFLRYFFDSTDFTQDQRPLNPILVGDIQQLEDLSTDISLLFPESSHGDPEFPDDYYPNPEVIITFSIAITLTVDTSISLTRENLSQNIRIQAQTSGAMAIFGFLDNVGRRKWKDIVNNLPQNNSQGWIEELEDSIFLAHEERVPQVVQLTFRAHDGRLYKPILYKRSKTNNSENFTVLFVEQISEGWVNAPNVSLATLLTASILGARLQWEICDRYLLQLDAWQSGDTETIKRNLREIRLSFDNIEEDASIRGRGEAPGLQNIDRLRDSFDSENERQTIVNNMREQEQHKQTLRNADTQDNVNEVKSALTQLERLNKIVTAMVAKRYSQLLNENTR
jgi:hypothetical protein